MVVKSKVIEIDLWMFDYHTIIHHPIEYRRAKEYSSVAWLAALQATCFTQAPHYIGNLVPLQHPLISGTNNKKRRCYVVYTQWDLIDNAICAINVDNIDNNISYIGFSRLVSFFDYIIREDILNSYIDIVDIILK